VAQNMYESVDDPVEKETFTLPGFLKEMAARGWLGDKTGQGFYKKVKGTAGTEIHVLDYKTLEYRPRQKAGFPSLEMARNAGGPDKQLQALLSGQDKGARFAWRVIKDVLVYAADKLPEIADDIQSVDEAMKWGFNWDLGPFELWDAIGVPRMVERLKAEGEAVPPVVEKLLASGRTSFYEKKEGTRYIFDWRTGESKQEYIPDGVIFLAPLKEQNRVIKSNPGASLIDIGDGVLCLEFHSRANAIGSDIVEMINYAVKEVEQNYEGMVIGNYGRHFSVGANLMLILMQAEDEEWDELDLMIREFQQANMRLKFCSKPVVAAPHSMAVGGGCEVCMHSHRVNAHAETYMGLVEVGVGLLPAGGGCKEMVLRAMELQTPETQIKVGGINTAQPLINRAFETIAMARVSTSGPEAIKLGFMRPTDRITMNRDRVIGDAKNLVLEMARQGFQPPRPATVRAVGTSGYAVLQLAIETLRWSNQITEHDARIAKKIAYVLTGGGVTPGTTITEQDLLDLEREAFLSLLGEPKTIERIRHMLATNKPLRN
ncbi:MAG: enoyl-CoA hydratase-related protein, partial [Desulfofundulus sp.]